MLLASITKYHYFPNLDNIKTKEFCLQQNSGQSICYLNIDFFNKQLEIKLLRLNWIIFVWIK